MKNSFTLILTLTFALLAAEVTAQRVAGPSQSRGSSSAGHSRPSGGSSVQSRPAPSPGRSYSGSPAATSRPGNTGRSYSSPQSAGGDRPVYTKPPVSANPGYGKPQYPTQTRPKPQYPTATRPQDNPGRGYNSPRPVPNHYAGTRPVPGQLSPSGTLNGNQVGTGKQENGQLPADPNGGPAGQQIVTICMFVPGSNSGVNRQVTMERAQELINSGQALMGSCSGDINGTNGYSMNGNPTLPTDPTGNGGLHPSGSMNGTPVNPNTGGNGGGLNPSGTMNGTPIYPNGGGGHNGGGNGGGYNGGGNGGGCNTGGGYTGGGFNTGGGCAPSGGYYTGGGYCGPSGGVIYNGGGCATGGFVWQGTYGGCQYDLYYADIAPTCYLFDITYCRPDRRTIILSDAAGTYHLKILEQRYCTNQYGRRYGSRAATYEWREVRRFRADCFAGCNICHR